MSERSSRKSDASGSTARARGLALALALLASASVTACEKRGGDGSRSGEPLRVAGAADLAPAFKDVGEAFTRATGKPVEFTFGSTGLLASQIAEGAPYDVFAAANVSYVDDVVRTNACAGETKRLYAQGRIVMWSADKALLPASLTQLRDPKYVKIAIANPEHAPYGLAAQQAMTRSGVWADVKPRAVYGENVQQTMMFAQSRNAEVAIVALSLAISAGGAYVPIDPSLHEPLDQALVACKGGSGRGKPNEARAFIDFVASEPGRAIMRRYGFLLPAKRCRRRLEQARAGSRVDEAQEPSAHRQPRAEEDERVDVAPLLLSFEVATLATLLAAIVGIAGAAILANFRFVGRDVLDVLFTAPMVMPPTVLGYYVLVLAGRHSIVGRLYESLTGSSIVFTATGAVVAATIGALPLVVKNVRASLEQTDPTLILAARTLGATRLRAFFSVQLPLAMRGVVAALMLAFARAIGDFGVTLMVAGDIPGKTRTASLAIYNAIQAQHEREAAAMVAVLTALTLGLLYAVGKLSARRDDER